MRSIWTGAISFGMVTIPVKLYTATEPKNVRFRLLHKDDNAPIEEKLEMARSLVANLADKFRPESYTDAYRTAVEGLIEQKMRGETRKSKRRKPEPKIVDLMDALTASINAAKGGPKPSKKPARKKTAKRSAA